jgi:hypothetical protein
MPFHPTGSPVLIALGDILVGFGPNGMKLSPKQSQKREVVELEVSEFTIASPFGFS